MYNSANGADLKEEYHQRVRKTPHPLALLVYLWQQRSLSNLDVSIPCSRQPPSVSLFP
jgi:hypothetical protein